MGCLSIQFQTGSKKALVEGEVKTRLKISNRTNLHYEGNCESTSRLMQLPDKMDFTDLEANCYGPASGFTKVVTHKICLTSEWWHISDKTYAITILIILENYCDKSKFP